MPLRDLSAAGVSFELDRDLPGLDAGDLLRSMKLRIGQRQIRGELLVMHLTPGWQKGAVCGGLLYPRDDEDIVELQQLLNEVETLFSGVRRAEPVSRS